jgi:hypothetical protein
MRYEPPKWVTALSILVIVGFVDGFMFLVTTFLFHFSSGQDRMGPVVTTAGLESPPARCCSQPPFGGFARLLMR